MELKNAIKELIDRLNDRQARFVYVLIKSLLKK